MEPPARTPYRVSCQISAALGLPPELYRRSALVLVSGGCLGVLNRRGLTTGGNGLISWRSCFPVLEHVAQRTLGFGKGVEFVSRPDVINGKPSLGVLPIPMSARSVERALALLAREHYLVKITFHRRISVTPIYGLHLPGILKLVKIEWDNLLNERQYARDPEWDGEIKDLVKGKRAKKIYAALEEALDLVSPFEPVFAHLVSRVDSEERDPVPDVDAFCQELRGRVTNAGKQRRNRVIA